MHSSENDTFNFILILTIFYQTRAYISVQMGSYQAKYNFPTSMLHRRAENNISSRMVSPFPKGLILSEKLIVFVVMLKNITHFLSDDYKDG